MADRYWVGGTANWDGTAGTKWATTSGGAGGASVPTSADDVYFDAASGAVTVTVGGFQPCASLNFTGFTGTISSTAFGVLIYGNLTLSSAMTITGSAFAWNFESTTTGKTISSNGKAITGNVAFRGIGGGWSLNDALSISGSLTVTYGTFTTNNYNVTASTLASSNSNTRTINLGSSTVTLNGTGNALSFATATNLTFNAGTSTINITAGGTVSLSGGGQTFNNVAFTNVSIANGSIAGANTFNNLTIAGRTAAGVSLVSITANQVINGTLTLSAGTNATCRTFLRSNTIGTTRTLTCAAVASLTDVDFRDITIAGAAVSGGNLTGTRLGDCKGNSGITFDAPKTVYWRSSGGGNFSVQGWADSPTAPTGSYTFFPLAQDTVVFASVAPSTGSQMTIDAAYNIGTIDMSARTSNTMTLATGSQSPSIYGNWINGTGTTLTGTGTLTFAGRGTQTITSAGKTFTQAFTIDTPGGSVTLQDAFTTDRSATTAFVLTSGTFDMNSYNATLSGASSRFDAGGLTGPKTLAVGSGTLTVAGTGGFYGLNFFDYLTITGTGTISLTSASTKEFRGEGLQTYPTLNQGGTGTLTVTGSNKFIGLTNTAIGRIQFTGGTTNEFTSFSINGVLGNLLPLGSTNTTQAILKKRGAWNVGANSTDGGNNTGLSFTAGDMDYLSISYVNGESLAAATGNFFMFFN